MLRHVYRDDEQSREKIIDTFGATLPRKLRWRKESSSSATTHCRIAGQYEKGSAMPRKKDKAI